MSKVIVRKARYEYDILKPVVFELMDSLAGDMVQRNARVVIKPNLLAPASPEQAITTHPLIIKAVAEYVLERGARPQVSDSPAVGSFEKILKESGIKTALKGLPVEYKEFRDSAVIDVGPPFKKIEIAADALDADVLINLPKLKTHTQMLLTLGVKNLFGCIVGMKKPEWHLRSGADRDMLATLLVKICQAVSPSVTIMDGILAMEGQGPGRSGTPRTTGVVLGSTDTASIDIVVCRMLGMNPDDLLTNRIAKEQGLVSGEIEIDGDLPVIRDFRFPEMTPVVFGPRRFHGFMRRHLVQRPRCNDDMCELCGECWKYCPAGAIEHDKKRLHFDYDKCIRCYCCIEVCPHGALHTHETITGKIVRRFLKI
jgi:uncharacterized protein (DUF362 family)/Pyruvate/2-oxoacid:ferredoxin oxidoreductase delta subunit